ncbi:hypothetical protein ZWY2020_026461 [Hordeum vulgare]|nr:hypothetical protein ZWY2020_026461 [Hordeum vulgare]
MCWEWRCLQQQSLVADLDSVGLSLFMTKEQQNLMASGAVDDGVNPVALAAVSSPTATRGSYYSFIIYRRPPYFINRQGTLRADRISINQSMKQGWMNQMAQLFNLWEIPAAVLSSFAAHLFLVLFAGIRRHKASGVLMLILWLAYQLANWVAPCALSNLSLCDPSPRQQLIAFWAPFLLHHLGGPDNISAFSLEDNALSGREALTVFSQIGGASYVLYKHVYIGSGGGGGSLIRRPSSFSWSVLPSMWRGICTLAKRLGQHQELEEKREATKYIQLLGLVDHNGMSSSAVG